MLRRWRERVQLAVALDHHLEVVEDRERPLLLALLVQVDRVGGEHDPAALGPDAERHLAARMAADQMEARSEEHTSELQSLMRISYAVFCLKKKKNNTNII